MYHSITVVNKLARTKDMFNYTEVKEYCKVLYFESIDILVTSIKERFNQKRIKLMRDIEEFSLMALNLEAALDNR